MSARVSVGLRFGFSRHCSVVSSAPSPLTSIEPPFEHDAGLRVARHAERLGHLPADLPIEIERRILAAPGVVVEVDGEPRLLGPWRA